MELSKDNDNVIESCTLFLEMAVAEYEELSSLCNQFAVFTHSLVGNQLVGSTDTNTTTTTTMNSSLSSYQIDNQLNPHQQYGQQYYEQQRLSALTNQIHRRRPMYHLIRYRRYIESIRELHEKMSIILSRINTSTHQLTTSSSADNSSTYNHDTKTSGCLPNHSYCHDLLKSHIDLSGRCIQTCTLLQSMDSSFIQDSVTENNHEQRIVALAVLNASIRKLKKKLPTKAESS